MGWTQVKSMRGPKGSQYATILKDGRLVLTPLLYGACGVKPGEFCELFVDRCVDDTLMIGVRPVAQETPWSVKCSSTGRLEDVGKRNASGRLVNLVVPLRQALNAAQVTLPRRLRVEAAWSPEEKMLIVRLANLTVTAADAVAEAS